MICSTLDSRPHASLASADCGLPRTDRFGQLRSVSFRNVASFLTTIRLRDHIERYLGWAELLELREEAFVREAIDLALADSVDPKRPLTTAIRQLKVRLPELAKPASPRQALLVTYEQVNRFLDAVQPSLSEFPPEVDWQPGGDARTVQAPRSGPWAI